MTTDKDKKVSRLYPITVTGKKKGPGTRLGTPVDPLINPLALRIILLVILAVATVFLAFPMPDSLLMGDVADRDVKADRDLMVEDRIATKEKREAARRASPTVFDLDDLANQGLREQVHQIFNRGRTIVNAPLVTSPIFFSIDSVQNPDPNEIADLRTRFSATFNVMPDHFSFEAMIQCGFSAQAEQSLYQLAMILLNQGIMAAKNSAVDRLDSGVLVRHIFSKQEIHVPYAATIPSLEEARRLVQERAYFISDDFSPTQTKALLVLSQSLLRPNLILNEKETMDRREAAAAKVTPVFFQVKRGEMIVREGQRLDEAIRLKLEAQADQADRRDWFPKASGFFVLAFVFLLVVFKSGFRVNRHLQLNDRDVLFLSTLLVIALVLAFAATQVGDAMSKGFPGVNKTTIFYLMPVAAPGMTATVFLGPLPGLFFSLVASALTGLVFDRSLHLFFYALIGSMIGWAGLVRVRERSAVIKSGLMVGVVNLGTIVALCLIEAVPLGRSCLYYFLAGLLSGLLSGVIVAGFIPLFEIVFKYTTNIKLLELANLDNPVLRELMVQAPGTYHHSVIVGAMVEAAAEAIGANPLLAKVSAYYHDLGKMNKPLYFVENQTSGENRHEKLAPSLSALILTSHVKDGVELARQHKLSPEIVSIVQQHHGTSLIAFFYRKAQSLRTEDQPEINIEDYRYPGPKPQTREAGLVMLADAVEAASRSIADPNPGRIQGMVQKIINNIFSDGQLDECELTLKDLHLIARSFNKILTGIFHRRISYPEPVSKDGPVKAKTANGHQSKQPPKDSNDKTRTGQVQGKGDLKRLGLS